LNKGFRPEGTPEAYFGEYVFLIPPHTFQGGQMIRLLVIVALLWSIAPIRAETVSLTGTVKKTGGTKGIPGVKVSLARLKSASATTDASGAFVINDPTGTLQVPGIRPPASQFGFQGNCLVFHSVSRGITGTVDIFSSDGKRKSSVAFHDLQAGRQTLLLPELASGITVVRVTAGGESFTRTVVRLGNELFFKQENGAEPTARAVMLSKRSTAAAVDTIVAAKDGYMTATVAIDSYSKKDIAINLDSAGGNSGPCTREALQAAVDAYVTAQKAGDPSKMPLASQVKYIQNMKDITADKSIVKTALPTIASQRDIFDVDSCRSFTELIVTAGSHPYVIGTRLKVEGGKISEINTMVTDKGDWGFDAAKYIDSTKNESWDILPTEKRCDRQTLINAGNAYFDYIFDWSKDTVPWGDNCYRIEGGSMIARPCIQGAKGNSVKTTCRTFVVDIDKGAVNLFCYFGYGPDSHLFKLENKKLRYIHTLTACGDTVKSGDCWGTASIGKGKAHCNW
jgi:hypothetical protein